VSVILLYAYVVVASISKFRITKSAVLTEIRRFEELSQLQRQSEPFEMQGDASGEIKPRGHEMEGWH
jgi:hypothetical protein